MWRSTLRPCFRVMAPHGESVDGNVTSGCDAIDLPSETPRWLFPKLMLFDGSNTLLPLVPLCDTWTMPNSLFLSLCFADPPLCRPLQPGYLPSNNGEKVSFWAGRPGRWNFHCNSNTQRRCAGERVLYVHSHAMTRYHRVCRLHMCDRVVPSSPHVALVSDSEPSSLVVSCVFSSLVCTTYFHALVNVTPMDLKAVQCTPYFVGEGCPCPLGCPVISMSLHFASTGPQIPWEDSR